MTQFTALDNYERISKLIIKTLSCPYSLLQKLARTKSIKINNKICKDLNVSVKKGDVIMIYKQIQSPKIIYKDTNYFYTLEYIKNITLYENENFLIINKERGWASQGGQYVKKNIDDLFKQVFDNAYFLVHRLDINTTGLMIISKDLETTRIFGDLFHNRQIIKKYMLITETVNWSSKVVANHLIKDGRSGYIIPNETANSYTKFIHIKSNDYYSLIEAQPKTGRFHQIRIHMASLGYGILGDMQYGNLSSNMLYLHSSYLEFSLNNKVYKFNNYNKNFDKII